VNLGRELDNLLERQLEGFQTDASSNHLSILDDNHPFIALSFNPEWKNKFMNLLETKIGGCKNK
jgi:hypothetical protein